MKQREPKIVLILDNIRSTYNVGAILRTAEGFGVEQVILSGYTPRPHDPNLLPHLRQKLDHQIHKTALGAEDLLQITPVDNIEQKLIELKNQGYQLIGLENNLNRPTVSLREVEAQSSSSEKRQQNEADKIRAIGSKQAEATNLDFKLSKKLILFLGEEVHGINPSLYDLIDLFIEIPMYGKKESFNVSVATGIALYALTGLTVDNILMS